MAIPQHRTADLSSPALIKFAPTTGPCVGIEFNTRTLPNGINRLRFAYASGTMLA